MDMFASLGQVYDLDNPAYIDANRSGRITIEQREFLGSRVAGWVGFLRFARGLRWAVMLFFLIPVLTIFLFAWGIHAFYVGGFFLLAGGALLGWLLVKWFRYRRWRKTLNRELEQGIIHHDVGTLRFGSRYYQVSLPDRRLVLPFLGKEDLQPGVRYRFYYLPESGTVLSAEAISAAPQQEGVRGLTAVLAEVNKFQVKALPMNRRGELSPSQLPLLTRHLAGSLLVVLIPVAIGVYLFINEGFASRIRGSGEGLVALIREIDTPLWVTGGVLAAVFIFLLIRFLRAFLDYWDRRVISVEGQGSVHVDSSTDDEGGTKHTYYYLVADRKFRVKRRAFLAFEPGRTYRAYFTPRSKKLVNIEVLD